ncbi:thiamine-binding protein [Sinomonas soli]
MIVAFSVSPSGPASDAGRPAEAPGSPSSAPSDSVHEAVAAAVRVVRESGLPNRTSSMFTEIEGEWDEVMDVVKRATEAVGRYGSRVSLVLKADIRPGHTGEITGKVERLERAIAGRAAEQPGG